MNKLRLIILSFLLGVLYPCMGQNSKMNEIQKSIYGALKEKVENLGLTNLDSDEVRRIKQDIEILKESDPNKLLLLFGYYLQYKPVKKPHYNVSNWEECTFYKDIDLKKSKYYNSTYPFFIIDEKGSIFSWTFTALWENGTRKKDRIGGITMTSPKNMECIDALYIKFYLENMKSVLITIDEEFTCNIKKNRGCALDRFDLETLSKAKLKSIEIIGKGEGSVIMPVKNPYMKRYFMDLANNFNDNVIK